MYYQSLEFGNTAAKNKDSRPAKRKSKIRHKIKKKKKKIDPDEDPDWYDKSLPEFADYSASENEKSDHEDSDSEQTPRPDEYKCPEPNCSYKHVTSYWIVHHLKFVHREKQEITVCRFCGEVCRSEDKKKNRWLMKHHLMTHVGEPNVPVCYDGDCCNTEGTPFWNWSNCSFFFSNVLHATNVHK